MFRLLVAFGVTLHCGLAFAQSTAKDGVVQFNVSGQDGGYGGGDGENAGDVNLTVSYADTAKTQISLQGSYTFRGKTTPISQVVAVAGLTQIQITAIGGDGGAGDNGQDGQDGWDGNNGFDGCPPSAGGNGGNGTDGTNGGPGGNGGRGGVIHIAANGDQTEILTLVKAVTAPGSGGSGGQGGRGGRAGRGGQGGHNNCVDQHGNPIPGPDGANGYDGYAGRDGSNGSSGSSGSSGSMSYDVNDGGTIHSYPRPFALSMTTIKTVDQNDDGIFEPGEELDVTQIVIQNTGPMPTPTGQSILFAVTNNSTLIVKKVPALAVQNVIAGNSSATLTFNKGDVALQGVDNVNLIGQKAVIDGRVSINQIGQAVSKDSGWIFHWPMGVSAGSDSARQYFASHQTLNFTLNNLTSKDIGPATSQPAEVVFSWNSKIAPGGDVTVKLPDGRTFALDQPYQVNDFTIPAKSKKPLPLDIVVQNSKQVLTATGDLDVTVRVKDFSSGGDDTVDLAKTNLFLAIDLRPVEVNHHLDVPGKIMCNYPDSQQLEYALLSLDFQKAKGADKITIHFSKDGLESPAYLVDAFDFAPYTDLLQTNTPSLIVGFTNDLLAPATQAGDVFWYFSGCYVLK